jgi:hypothetical protein
MSSNDPEHDGGPDAEHSPPSSAPTPSPAPEPEPLDVDSAFAAIVAGWGKESPTTWPAQEDLTLGRHRRPDDGPELLEDRRPDDSRPEGNPPDERFEDGPPADLALSGAPGALTPSVGQPEAGPEDDIGRADAFVPPDPPLPRGDAISTVAWAAVVLGPLFLLLSVFWRTAPDWMVLAAVAAFIGGFVTLVARMPRHRDDDGDDGAVV